MSKLPCAKEVQVYFLRQLIALRQSRGPRLWVETISIFRSVAIAMF